MRLTHESLLAALDYDPDTGVFRWKIKPNRRIVPGREAGRWNKGYRMVKVYGVEYAAHRLAWFYVHKRWPTKEIDHINREPSDNRIANLREASPSENSANQKRKNNTTGYKGIYFGQGRYHARVVRHRKCHYIGSFPTPEEAHAAYVDAARVLHGKFACAG